MPRKKTIAPIEELKEETESLPAEQNEEATSQPKELDEEAASLDEALKVIESGMFGANNASDEQDPKESAEPDLDQNDVPGTAEYPSEDGEAPVSTDYNELLHEVSAMGLNGGGEEPLTLADAEKMQEPEAAQEADAPQEPQEAEDGEPTGLSDADRALMDDEEGAEEAPAESEPVERAPEKRRAARKPAIRRDNRILTIDAHDEVQSEKDREAALWHDIQNAHRMRRVLTGTLDSVERTESGMTVAVVSYNGFRVVIPHSEMLLYNDRRVSGSQYEELMDRVTRNLNARLGSELDFVIKGYENESRSVVASRKDAMYRKRQTFYLDTDDLGEHMIYEGRVVQARVVAVAEKIMRVEVFGVECAIRAPGMSWEWIGNARERYHVGDRVLVRVLRISGEKVEDLRIDADIRSVSGSTGADSLSKCVVQGRYVGKVTDVRGGVVFINLNNGVNAIAHSCYDSRSPGKKDDVCFAVTRLDEKQGIAIGAITRIIRQNI